MKNDKLLYLATDGNGDSFTYEVKPIRADIPNVWIDEEYSVERLGLGYYLSEEDRMKLGIDHRWEDDPILISEQRIRNELGYGK